MDSPFSSAFLKTSSKSAYSGCNRSNPPLERRIADKVFNLRLGTVWTWMPFSRASSWPFAGISAQKFLQQRRGSRNRRRALRPLHDDHKTRSPPLFEFQYVLRSRAERAFSARPERPRSDDSRFWFFSLVHSFRAILLHSPFHLL